MRENIARVYQRIEDARATYQAIQPVHLELAIKTQSAETCGLAAQALADPQFVSSHPILLGQNRVQEAVASAEAVKATEGASLHLIGPLQRNKINQALKVVDLVETVDSLKLAEALNQRVVGGPLPIFLQVNVSGETAKSGVAPAEFFRLAEAVLALENLKIAGLMTVAGRGTEAEVRPQFATMQALRDELAQRFDLGRQKPLELSMGMSGDMEWAIAEGATIVRAGTAIFGPRATR
ncbi:YggS family pyridoxal phosphate enzyme [Boudabousia tangfeifanii]|uniref:Pyridoxal phosphate homeostasis protein n=1 Tax=Boudabousia tangfeifanii TaxID=1912795 RepID=A0A1D9MN05_9ACTO|nr:YggS family pyridoxal phosphate enzyme [Boudabousia tangfeifanii]